MNFTDQIQAAVGAHGLWKTRLRVAIGAGASDFSVAVVKQDDQCAFGKWLHGDGLGPEVRQSPQYERCVDLHRRFHLLTAGVLALALEGKKEDAVKAMETGSEFAHASAALTLHMMEWQASCASEAA
jgi:methyl-accepting chemotaxis protein